MVNNVNGRITKGWKQLVVFEYFFDNEILGNCNHWNFHITPWNIYTRHSIPGNLDDKNERRCLLPHVYLHPVVRMDINLKYLSN